MIISWVVNQICSPLSQPLQATSYRGPFELVAYMDKQQEEGIKVIMNVSLDLLSIKAHVCLRVRPISL